MPKEMAGRGPLLRGRLDGEVGDDTLTSGTSTGMPIERHSARYIGGLVLVVLDRGQQAGQVLHRVVRLEPRRLVADEAVTVRVRLVEGVVGERLDHVEQLVAELARRSPCASHPSTNFSRSLAMTLALLLAGGLAEVVGLVQRVAGELLRHPHHRLLVDHQPVRVAEHRAHVGVQVVDRLAAVLPVGVVVVHVGRHRPGRYSATSAATSSNSVGARARMRARIGPPSSWNTPMESPRRSSSSVGSSSRGDVVDVRAASPGCTRSMRSSGMLDDVEVAQARGSPSSAGRAPRRRASRTG